MAGSDMRRHNESISSYRTHVLAGKLQGEEGAEESKAKANTLNHSREMVQVLRWTFHLCGREANITWWLGGCHQCSMALKLYF